MKLKKIVLTGGPCAGKTTVLEALRSEYARKVIMVPEMATTLLNGFPVPGRDVRWVPEWQASFQTAVLVMQEEVEKAYGIMAEQSGAQILVCDRGLLDGAAYTLGGVDEFCRLYKIHEREALDEYDAVIHLQSLAVGQPESYGQFNNDLRFESKEEAAKLENAIRDAWSRHSKHLFVSCEKGLEGKISQAKEIVETFLED